MIRRLLAAAAFCCAIAPAALVRIEVIERTDVLDGKAFGKAGAYERVIGKAYFAADPSLDANRIVADLDRAPRNDKGLVEYSADIYILKPRDPRMGNGAALYEVSNRGGKGMLGMFNRAAGSTDPRDEKHFGDALLLEQGYLLVWLGWQFDVPQEPGRMRLYTPRIAGVTGPVRAEFIPDAPTTAMPLADRGHIAYAPADPKDPKAVLTVRDRTESGRRTIPRVQWSIDGDRVVMKAGFQPGRIYELVYTGKDPAVVGLGPAAVRDLISFLKYGGNGVTLLGDHSRYIKRAYGFGVS